MMEHLEIYAPGIEYTICGGCVAHSNPLTQLARLSGRFRRGKPDSNDVDIVFAPPQIDQDIGLLRNLYRRLTALGIITHVLRQPREKFLNLLMKQT